VDISFLNKKDTYSFLFSALYAADADPNYMLLSDLLYVLDEKTFKNFVSLFEGQTISVPSIDRISEMMIAIMIYTYHDVDKRPLDIVMKDLGLSVQSGTQGTSEYRKLKQLIKDKKVELGGMFNDFPTSST